MTQRFTLIAAPHLFLIKDNHILLARRYNTGYQDGNYSVPAGHIDGGESVTTAMIREAKEEIGIEILAEDLVFAHVMHRITNRESADFFFFCRSWKGEPSICEPDKCDELKWAPVDQLPENTIDYIQVAIKKAFAKKLFSEMGW